MNPAFILLVLMGLITLWFLLSFAYRPLGALLRRIWDDAIKAMNEENKNEE